MRITPKQYAQLLYAMTKEAEKGALTKAVRAFIVLLARNRALQLLPKIQHAYVNYYNREEDVLDVVVTSAHILPNQALKGLKELLKEQHIEWATQINRDLIGGVSIKIGDYMLDNTLKARLSQLKHKFAL